MPALKDNWYIEKGATFRKRYQLGTGTEDNFTPLDLTGRTARCMLRKSLFGEVIQELTTENGGITLGGVDGYVDIFISAEDTTALPGDECVHDIELVNGSDVDRILEGEDELSPEVTRDD